MSDVMISKAEMMLSLQNIAKSHVVAAPVCENGVVDFATVTNTADVLTDDSIPYKSLKSYFFPRCEKMMTFTSGEVKAVLPAETTVVFGVRPCDLEALKVMTKVFTAGKYHDPFFCAHKENTILIGVGCNEKKPGCFCDARETDMAYSEECDLFLHDCGGGYKVMYVSDKGKKELSPMIHQIVGFENKSYESLSEINGTVQLPDKNEELFGTVDWERITETCQSCGLCTYICPTCHCFEFKDVAEGDTESRYRNWDSCMYPKFTLHASGHNPRETKAARYRQRVLHKYVYVKRNTGSVACTGCGRCIRSCPAGMNIRAVVTGIEEALS